MMLEARFQELYAVSFDWINGELDNAHDTGYIEGCFGLKIRTPLLKRALKSAYKMTYMVAAERRSAGNAKTQSYGMLNTRATGEFMQRVWKSKYRYDVMPCAQIHDATYFVWKDNLHITKWVNDNLTECMSWQEAPELHHDIIKLGAALDIYWPHWGSPLTLPNGVSVGEIRDMAKQHVIAVNNKK